ncbi:(2Fe-2S) ferredoxin [Eoetvoesiella caeni]|uniref:(2Fe-2S) ferredoxin n=2 Tax=Eoetvoesiella caeni TaxID=645616 RepID=A0A366H1T5_9BURK|nr:(2Fe-2S) ferredoxin [Eoetvoesiella caeni]
MPMEIYVCNNIDCKNRGSERVVQALKTEFSQPTDVAVHIHKYLCFSACNSGPNVIIPDRRCWLSAVSEDDAGIVRAVLEGAAPPARLQEKNTPELEAMILGIIDAGLLEPEDS